MYSSCYGCGNGCNAPSFTARNFNFDTSSYFRVPLEYRVGEAQPIYRTSAYIGVFNFGFSKMIYGGASMLEKYLVRNMLRMQVGLEYAANKLGYSNKFDYDVPQTTSSIIHNPEDFLLPNRPDVEFIDNLTPQLKKKVAQIFKLTTGTELPNDILISLLPEQEMEKQHSKHSKKWNKDIQGFAVNRKHMNDFSSVFVKQNPLDMLILTIGHEIGHCLSIMKEDLILEEAKAFAFELAWMKTIHKHDILGLKESMKMSLLNPSENGLHNVAFDIVKEKLNEKEPIDVFRDIVNQ
jgi:hypothetical protein